MNETHVTIRGNLVAEPERIASTKGDFTTFRVAVNEFHRDQAGGGYVDGRSSFYKIVAYRAVGANAQKSLSKGTPVLVHGILRMSQWQTSTGESRSTPEIEAINVGPDLRFGIATFQRVPGQGNRGGVERPNWQRDQTAPAADNWGNDSDASAHAPEFVDPADQEQASSSGPLVEQKVS